MWQLQWGLAHFHPRRARARMVISPASVNFTAFPTRFSTIRRTRSGSPTACT